MLYLPGQGCSYLRLFHNTHCYIVIKYRSEENNPELKIIEHH